MRASWGGAGRCAAVLTAATVLRRLALCAPGGGPAPPQLYTMLFSDASEDVAGAW